LKDITMSETTPKGFVDLTASIVSAYVSNNATTATGVLISALMISASSLPS